MGLWGFLAGEIVGAIIVGYVLGSIPFGLVITHLAGLGDIRAIGSGNIGATNVLRTGHKGLALATLLLDGGKGAAAVVIVTLVLSPFAGLIAGTAAVIGHNFPIWLRFKGGKGVATTLGMICASVPLVGLMACATWLIMAALFRYSSLAALTALALAPVYAVAVGEPEAAIAFAILGVLGWIRHHANLRRLLHGEEPKIGGKKA